MSKKSQNVANQPEIELRPDGWERFEKAIDAAAKAGPKHHAAPKPKARAASKGRVRKGKSHR